MEETDNSVVIEINGSRRFDLDDINDYLIDCIVEDTIDGCIVIHDGNCTYRHRFVKELSTWGIENTLRFWEDFHFTANGKGEVSQAPKVYVICELAWEMTTKKLIKGIKGIWTNKELAEQAITIARRKGEFNYVIIEARLGSDWGDLLNWEVNALVLD